MKHVWFIVELFRTVGTVAATGMCIWQLVALQAMEVKLIRTQAELTAAKVMRGYQCGRNI